MRGQNGWIHMRFFRKEYKYLLMLIVGIFLIMPIPSLGLDNGYARMVYNVSGVQNYQLHWNDRFPPNSTLMIYVEADGINHRRTVGVDYVFIIKDSNDNIVNYNVVKNRYKDYRENDFVKYSQKITEDWEDGSYTAEIHIFDLLNDSIMYEYYQNITSALVTGENVSEIPYMSRETIFNNSELKDRNYRQIVQNFYVDKYANKYPSNRFMIKNLTLDRYILAPGMPININVTIENTFYDRGSISMDVLLDNSIIGNKSIDVDAYSSKNIIYTIPTEIAKTMEYGNHTLEIIPTGDNTAGYDLYTTFEVIKIEIDLPTEFYYRDIQTNKLAFGPDETVNINVTVENKGKAGYGTVGLIINNLPVEEKKVYINFSEVIDVPFNISEKEIGEYRITLNNSKLSKVFFVEISDEAESARQLTEEDVKDKNLPKVLTILGLSILVIVIYIIRKRFVINRLSEISKTDENISDEDVPDEDVPDDINVEDFKKMVE